MNIDIPNTLEELRNAFKAGNPVEIAGYGRESTHKGYLSWILNSCRWEGAKKLAYSLITYDVNNEISINFEDIQNVECEWERYLGKRKVDLILLIQLKGNNKRIIRIPIELKTDSALSDDNQIADLSEYVKSQHDIPKAFLFCLGSSFVQDYDRGNFILMAPKAIYKLWEGYLDDAPSYFKDWMEALGYEISRNLLAQEVYKLTRSDYYVFYTFGYRSYKQLMHYIYRQFVDSIVNKGIYKSWVISSSTHNALLEHWPENGINNKILQVEGVSWYFHFRDDDFYLGIGPLPEDLSVISKWITRCVEEMKLLDPQNQFKTRFKLNPSKNTKWMHIARWKTDFTSFDNLCDSINSIMNLFGRQNIMGKNILEGA